ncbi:uncharacterized [Tachysurus ichikawai]
MRSYLLRYRFPNKPCVLARLVRTVLERLEVSSTEPFFGLGEAPGMEWECHGYKISSFNSQVCPLKINDIRVEEDIWVTFRAKETKPFEQRKDALDASQGERLQKWRLSPWDVLLRLSQKRPETSVPNFVLQIFPPSTSLEIQTAGKLTLALVGKEGNMNSCQLI